MIFVLSSIVLFLSFAQTLGQDPWYSISVRRRTTLPISSSGPTAQSESIDVDEDLTPPPATTGASSTKPGKGTPTISAAKSKASPHVNYSFEGLNHRDSRLAYNGNQFDSDPPYQALCAGNGYILESVNWAMRIFDTTGEPLTPVKALNEFYGYPPNFDRTKFTFPGPFLDHVSCHYDPDSDRWFHLMVSLEQTVETYGFTGRNYLELAVSASGDPTGDWSFYSIPGMNDGTEGTPQHNCPGGTCFADFPQIGVDKNGVYITTNEYQFPFSGENVFVAAQVYAISKKAVVSGADEINVLLFNTADDPVRPREPGFTLWPALSAGNQSSGEQGGTNYFVSSNAFFDVDKGDSNEIIVWALSNTRSLSRTNPDLRLRKTIVPSLAYGNPPDSVQKSGSIPLGSVFYGASKPGVIETGDARISGARYANGKLWAVAGTAAETQGKQQAGVFWIILKPSVSSKGVSATVRKQGILALPDEALAYPTVGVTPSGRGVIGFTRVGINRYPSVGYTTIDDVTGVGSVYLIRDGQSPQDGFVEYPPFRPRWGEYGAAAVDGNVVYLAGEYIEALPCSNEIFESTEGDCFGDRTYFANWATRVTKLTA